MADRVSSVGVQDLTRENLLDMLRRMWEIRIFENTVYDLLGQNVIKGASHLYAGQEAVAVGAIAALRPDDYITSTHRGHGHCHAHGDSHAATPEEKQEHLNKMMAELCGRATGYCRGRGGSMHIAAFETGSLGALAVVGSGIPIAVGAALAFKMRHEDRVSVSFTGDGGCNTGNFHEGLNLAAIWDLPFVLVLENNQYAISTRIERVTRVKNLAERAAAYGVPGVRVDGFDVLAVYDAARQAVDRARQGKGPTLLVTESYRLEGHYAGEPEVYRAKSEVAEQRNNDPIAKFRVRLVQEFQQLPEAVDTIERQVGDEIREAVRFAKESPSPDPSTALDYIYA